jgi:hypothetical protein
MVTVTVVVATVVVACAVMALWSRSGGGRNVARDVDRFAAARAMTSRWADDPTSAPKPVLDMATQRAEADMALNAEANVEA